MGISSFSRPSRTQIASSALGGYAPGGFVGSRAAGSRSISSLVTFKVVVRPLREALDKDGLGSGSREHRHEIGRFDDDAIMK